MRLRSGTRAAQPAHITLTPRQEEVMALLRKGYTNGRIAEALGITLDGAKFHVAEIISKLGANSREDAVAIWSSRQRIGLGWPAFGIWRWTAAVLGAGSVAIGGALWVASLQDGPIRSNKYSAAADQTPRSATPRPDLPADLVPCPAPPTPGPTPPSGSGSAVDWLDFVNFEGVSYLSYSSGTITSLGRQFVQIDPARLGEAYGRVQVNVREAAVNPTVRRSDCEAAFLHVGEILYRIDGYDPHFRIASETGKVYQAYRKEGAKTAAEFLDLRGKVTGIAIADNETAAILATIDDPLTIANMVVAVLDARFDDSVRGTSGPTVRLFFRLTDGTSWEVPFSLESSWIWPGIFVSDTFTAPIRAALNP